MEEKERKGREGKGREGKGREGVERWRKGMKRNWNGEREGDNLHPLPRRSLLNASKPLHRAASSIVEWHISIE